MDSCRLHGIKYILDHEESAVELENQFYVGSLLPESSQQIDKRSFWNNILLAITLALVPIFGVFSWYSRNAMAIFISKLLAAVGVMNTARFWWRGKGQRAQTYICSGCQHTQASIVKYKCGMCNEDFCLCPECFAGDDISLRHHIFLKLKFPQRRQLPLGPVLRPQAFGLAEALDYGNSVHGRAYIHRPDRLHKLSGIKCSSCGVLPIRGTRYKCGMCSNYDLCSSCEVYSHEIHERSHVFLVLKHKADINFISEPLVRALLY